MKNSRERSLLLGVCFLLTLVFLLPAVVRSGQATAPGGAQGGLYIDLTRDFYEALREESRNGEKVYSNSMSDEYLRQISVSTRFMVETNLRILRQQEKMIQLLECILEGKAKK